MNLQFFLNFFKNPFRNASIVPSSKYLIDAMLENIDFQKIDSIIELWSWDWCISKEIINRAKIWTKIILIEIESSYIKNLNKFKSDNIFVENQNAENLQNILEKYKLKKPDMIISTLPTNMPNKYIVFDKIQNFIENWTIFRNFTYMYYFFNKNYKKYKFKKIKFVFKNFPPAWVYWNK